MKKIDPTVQKETRYIAGWVVLLSAAMELAFWLTGNLKLSVPLGNLLGATAAILNFFFMALTVQLSVGLDEKAAAAKLKLSQLLRMLLLGALVCLGVVLSCFHTLAVIAPLFFPRIAVAFRPLLDRRGQAASEERGAE